MLFNSVEFMFLFLPIVLLVYFFLNKKHLVVMANIWIIVASLFFYGFITPSIVPLLAGSVLVNFALGSGLNSDKLRSKVNRRLLLLIGIILNLSFIGYFKYMDFFISNVNTLFHATLNLMHIALPLGISFYTFQQIAYLIDSYHGETKEYDFLNYTIFVVFFPQLVAGPILHHAEMMPQFARLKNKFINWKNLSQGLLLFIVGMFKKVIIADTVAQWANLGFNATTDLSCVEAWSSMLSYTFQIYYDFSGYTDMALGIALMFNIKLPQNFNNPYCALDINDFWRRWHITLSKFFRDYVYIPLGGNRKGFARTYFNQFAVFFLCGLWHGASWMFVIWGLMHGLACIINKMWKRLNIEIPKFLAWISTFIFVNIAWVFFRATSMTSAKRVLKGAFGLNGFSIPKIYGLQIEYAPEISRITSWETIVLFALPLLMLIIFAKPLHEKIKAIKISKLCSVMIAIMFVMILVTILNPSYTSPFIYFNF